jgi:hypothetical protein
VQLLIKFLRREGALIPQPEVDALPWTLVNLMTESSPRHRRRCLALRAHDDGAFSTPRHELYEVRLASITSEQLVLRGIEQLEVGGRIAAVVQELACKPAPELGAYGWQSPRAREFSRDLASLMASAAFR